MLLLPCPHCKAELADDLEVLDSGEVDRLRCENAGCGRQFWYMLCECVSCGEETVFTWQSVPAPDALAALSCEHCGVPFDEAAGETPGQDATRRIQ